jgi:tetratricopeptide (TPR) repeat protein
LDQAIENYDEALRLNPKNWSALSSRGINLLRLGREEEGIQSLERAYRNDPYNIWTVNTLRLVDSFEDFERFSTPHFSVKLHREESEVLRPYVAELLEDCLAHLESRYDHQIDGQVVFEMYPDHEDFAVRTLGMPGLGALGATFGKVVAMDSPSARPPGEFHWASTLWHELGHVVTLSLSDGRVPRWFTEGLSMMEERSAGEGWGDGLSIPFVRAYEGGELLPLKELNAGFVRPRSSDQLRNSYYQAGWLCDVLVREFGMVRIRDMLLAYGEGKRTDEVFETILDSTVDEVDGLFHEELARALDPLKTRLAEPEATPKDPEALRTAVSANPDNYFLNFALGRQLSEHGAGNEAAVYLQKAIDLFPAAAGPNSPYASLCELYRKDGQTAAEIKLRRAWWARAPMFVGNALRLAELLVQEGKDIQAVGILEEAMYVDPFSREAHTLLGNRYLGTGEAERAVREFSVVLALNPPNPAEAHFQLASALSQSGATDAAKRQVLLALERAPGWEQAQKLLLELVRQ